MAESGADISIPEEDRVVSEPKEASGLVEKREAIKGLTENLLKRIDYDAVLSFHQVEVIGSDQTLSRTVDDLFYLRRTQMTVAFGTLDSEGEEDLEYREATLRRYQEDWDDNGFLKRPEDAEELPPLVYGEPVLEEQRKILTQLEWDGAVLQRLAQLYKTYRENVTTIQASSRWQEDLSAAFRLDNWRPDFQEALDKFGMDPRLLDAVNRFIYGKETTLSAAGKFPQTEEERNFQIKKAREVKREAISIEGFGEGIEGTISEYIRKELAEEIPPYFLQGLKKVSIKDKSTHEARLGNEVLPHMASLLTEWHFGYIKEVALELYREGFNTLPANSTETQRIATILSGVNHEVGHNIHYRLTYEEMEGWEGVIAAERVGITKYVQLAYKNDVDRAKREDFSESFSIFVNNPGLLKIIAPTRFAYMAALLDRYLPDDERERFARRLNTRALTFILYAGEKGWTTDDVIRDSGAKPLD